MIITADDWIVLIFGCFALIPVAALATELIDFDPLFRKMGLPVRKKNR